MASVKNFIFSSLVEQKGDKKGFNHNADDHLVVFGKIGKDAFNLDIKHPFSILHGLTMAMSSLKKKLLCE